MGQSVYPRLGKRASEDSAQRTLVVLIRSRSGKFPLEELMGQRRGRNGSLVLSPTTEGLYVLLLVILKIPFRLLI